GRAEVLQVETEALLAGSEPVGDPDRPLGAFTVGTAYDVFHQRGFEGAFGADVTFYAVPEALQATHGSHPGSFQLFFRLPSPAPRGRMWNMRMSQPMAGHRMH